MKLFIAKLRLFLSQFLFEKERHSKWQKHVDLSVLYNHKCGYCGKKLEDHKLRSGDLSEKLDEMKIYYDLNTCKVPEGFYDRSFHCRCGNDYCRKKDSYLFDLKTHKKVSLFKKFLLKKEQIFNSCSPLVLEQKDLT